MYRKETAHSLTYGRTAYGLWSALLPAMLMRMRLSCLTYTE